MEKPVYDQQEDFLSWLQTVAVGNPGQYVISHRLYVLVDCDPFDHTYIYNWQENFQR